MSNGTRTPGDLEDRAAKYMEKDNLILANKDFQGFIDVIEHFKKRWDLERSARRRHTASG